MHTDLAFLVATGKGQELEVEGDILPVLRRMRGRKIFHAIQFFEEGLEKLATSSSAQTLPLENCKAVILYAIGEGDKMNPSKRALLAPDFCGGLVG